jgi:hypothetical protein
VRPIARVLRNGPFIDVPLEPLIVKNVVVRGGSPITRRAAIACRASFALLAAVAACLGTDRVEKVLDWSGPLIVAGPLLVAFAASRTYCRIVPGRLDLMGGTRLGGSLRVIQRVDLRAASIFADLSRRAVVIDGGDHRVELGLQLVPRAELIVHRLILAAVSSHDPPPLPDDSFLG